MAESPRVPRPPDIAVLPRRATYLDEAVAAGGGRLADAEVASGLIWTRPRAVDELAEVLDDHPDIGWVQLPSAGVEGQLSIIRSHRDVLFTNAKVIYAPPVAEMALGLLIALFRDIDRYARETTWTKQGGRTLIGARVTIVGGGGIARSLTDLLTPFDCRITVVRRHDRPFSGAERVLTTDRLSEALADADAVVLALPLLDDTVGILGAEELAMLPEGAIVVNVARGGHIDTDALVDALRSGHLGGAGLDVTEPEPLPDGHPLWTMPGVLITPHSANFAALSVPFLSEIITDNVSRWIRGEEMRAVVDPDLGY